MISSSVDCLEGDCLGMRSEDGTEKDRFVRIFLKGNMFEDEISIFSVRLIKITFGDHTFGSIHLKPHNLITVFLMICFRSFNIKQWSPF